MTARRRESAEADLGTLVESQEVDLGRQVGANERQSHSVNRFSVTGTRVFVLVVVLGLWQEASGRWIPSFIVSSPVGIIRTLINFLGTGTAWHDVQITAIEFLLGYVIGVLTGALLGIILAQSEFASAVFVPLVAAVNGIPKIALAPLFLIALGLGVWSKIAIAAMSVFFVMFYNMYSGIRATPQPLIDVLRIFGASKATTVRYVMIPAVAPSAIAGLRAGIPFAMIGVVVGEFIASNSGVGYYINQQTQQFNTAGAFAGIILIVAMVLVGNGAVTVIESRALRGRVGG